MAPKVKAPKPAPKKVDAAPKADAEGAKAPVKAVQKAHKVQKKVVKGLHGTRVKKVRTSVKFYRPHTFRPARLVAKSLKTDFFREFISNGFDK